MSLKSNLVKWVSMSEMSSSLRKLLAVWSCAEIVVLWWRHRWWEKVEKQMIIIALNLVKQLECHGVTLFWECSWKFSRLTQCDCCRQVDTVW